MPDRSADPVQLPMAGTEVRERGDAAANRVRILEAARRLLAERGPGGLTMDAVACEARVGKGTIFRRFGDRDGLADALVDGDMRAFQEGFLRGPPPLGPGAPASQRLEAFVVGLLRHFADHLDVALLADASPAYRSSPVYAALLLHARMLVREIDPDIDDRVVARLLLSAISPSLILEERERGRSPETLEAAALALLRGLTARAGAPRR